MAAQPMTEPQLQKALTSKKRNFTRHINAAGKTTAYALAHPTTDSATAVRQAQDRVDDSYKQIMDTLDALVVANQDDDQETLDEIERQKVDNQDRYETILERCLSCLEKVKKAATDPTAPPQPAGGGGGGGARPKTNDSLKPDRLQMDNTPAELRSIYPSKTNNHTLRYAWMGNSKKKSPQK